MHARRSDPPVPKPAWQPGAPLQRRLGWPGLLVCAATLAGCGDEVREPRARWEIQGADLARGRQLMTHYQCGSCHQIPGVPGGSRQAPALDGFVHRSFIAGQWPNTPEGLQQWLMDPPAVVPGTTMPRLGVSEADARDMAAYLLSLP